MEKSIESIWKEGFLQSDALIAPTINNLYEQKSKHVIDKLTRMFKVNLIALVIMAVAIMVIYYFIDAVWQGVVIAVMLFALTWYSKRQMTGIKMINKGASSYDYLKAFDSWLKELMSKNVKIMRLFYPMTFLIAASTVWFAGSNEAIITKAFPDIILVWDMPLFGLIGALIISLIMAYFSDKLYRWDVRLVYGRVFDKLEETIVEMEKLRG
ncbi:MAG: hypothetical protein JXQ96_11280 [Cyclobacteriaceae bacterium]